MANELKTLRVSRGIPGKDMVAVVQQLYPKFDKTTLSKCENGKAYGVTLREDARVKLYERFAPELVEAGRVKKKDTHRLTRAVKARLTDDAYERLQRVMEVCGYATAQDLITELVVSFILQKEAEIVGYPRSP